MTSLPRASPRVHSKITHLCVISWVNNGSFQGSKAFPGWITHNKDYTIASFYLSQRFIAIYRSKDIVGSTLYVMQFHLLWYAFSTVHLVCYADQIKSVSPVLLFGLFVYIMKTSAPRKQLLSTLEHAVLGFLPSPKVYKCLPTCGTQGDRTASQRTAGKFQNNRYSRYRYLEVRCIRLTRRCLHLSRKNSFRGIDVQF